MLNYRRLHEYTYARHGNSRWQRMSIKNVIEKYATRYNNFDVFMTVQRYASKIEEDNEDQWCQIFFDLDAPKGDDTINTKIEVQKEAVKIIDFFTKLGVQDELIRVWWSGGRGFHITVDPEIFGIKPHPELTNIIKLLAFNLTEFLELKYLDRNIYSIKRMWRLNNSLHAKSKLFKIELTLYELMNSSIEDIMGMAKKPRKSFHEEIDYESINPELNKFWMRYVNEYESLEELRKLKPRKTISIKKGEFPICMKDFLSGYLKTKGTRNRAVMVLAGFLKDSGYTETETINILIDWSKKIPKALSTSSERERIDNCISVVKTVFNDHNYHFSCAFIRSLGTQENPVECDYDICKYVKAEDQAPIEPIETDLMHSSKASFVGMPLKVSCMVSGKDTTPYSVPRHIKLDCEPVKNKSPKNICNYCKLSKKGGMMVVKLASHDPTLLKMINVSDVQLRRIIQQIAKIPSQCKSFKIDVMDYGNLVDTQLIPRIKFSAETMLEKNEYAVRRALFSGHDIESSKEYELLCYAFPDPKTQYSLLLITEKKELEMSDIELNANPKALLSELKLFQPKENTSLSIKEKLEEKWNDLTTNITKIYGRNKFSIALDMVFHSPIAFYFNEEFVSKGWLELIAMGDSAQGKTQCVQKMIEHYKAGTMVSGETSRRTGLIYNIQQTGDRWFLQWGIIPLNDMRLVTIDEFHELDEEDIKNMTSLRDGIARVDRVVKAKTPSRTRLIYLCNPKGDPLSKWDFRVIAIRKLFKTQEDLRRVDFAITLTSGDVDVPNLSRSSDSAEKIPHVFTSSKCNMLVRWVWSLKPHNISFTKEATEYILNSVKPISNMFTPIIQLTEPGDLRKKLAKLSAAIACMMFSTKDGINLVVDKSHSEYAIAFLAKIYQEMDYGEYTTMVNRTLLNRSKINDAKSKIREAFKAEDNADIGRIVIDFLLANHTFSKNELVLITANKSFSQNFINMIYVANLVTTTLRGRLKKSASFIQILKELRVEIEKQGEQQSLYEL